MASLTAVLAAGLESLGYTLAKATAIDTLTVETGDATASIADNARKAGANLRLISKDRLGI